MMRLKGRHRGERAAIILGGPSLLAPEFDFASLNRRGFVTLVDTKALTPHLLESGLVPDYHLLLFPEKSKDNTLQHFVYRSLLAGVTIDRFLQPGYREVPKEIRARFEEYLESWRPQKGAHKRYRWKQGVYLRDSPYDLLARCPSTQLIVNRPLIDEHFPQFAYGDRAFYFEQGPREPVFDADKYFRPLETGDRVQLRCADGFLNSAAIALYPLLAHMGFREVYFLGMDMSMLGCMEYAAPHTFRSMLHYWWFFRRTRHAFNANYQANGWFFHRPQSEFEDLRRLWALSPVSFIRVYEPWRFTTPVAGIPTVSMRQFQAA